MSDSLSSLIVDFILNNDLRYLTFKYGTIGDVLRIDYGHPSPCQILKEIEDGIIARFNPHTKKLEGLEILFFSKRHLELK